MENGHHAHHGGGGEETKEEEEEEEAEWIARPTNPFHVGVEHAKWLIRGIVPAPVVAVVLLQASNDI